MTNSNNQTASISLPLNHFPGTYVTFDVSDDGETINRRELTLPDGRVLQARTLAGGVNNRGHRQINVNVDAILTEGEARKQLSQQWTRHRLVAAAFLGLDYMNKGLDVHHKNNIHQDNRVENLQVVTKAEHRELHRTAQFADLPLFAEEAA